MKRLLFFSLMALGLSSYSDTAKAQTVHDQASAYQKSDDGLLVAYPNPAKDYIILKSKDPLQKIKDVSFYSILGVQVAHFSVNMNAGEINIDKLRPGKYLMRYTLSDNTQKVTQIIKQ